MGWRELIGRGDMGKGTEANVMIGRSMRRLEDARFLTGRARYVADRAAADDLICVTGSFFLAAEMRALILNEGVERLALAARR